MLLRPTAFKPLTVIILLASYNCAGKAPQATLNAPGTPCSSDARSVIRVAVTDRSGAPITLDVRGFILDLHCSSDVGASGTATITRVPAGRHLVTAATIGYEVDSAAVTVGLADTVAVTLHARSST
jgi:hypothetical protein